jgi:tetratricopeptide (TPR) repeat protein
VIASRIRFPVAARAAIHFVKNSALVPLLTAAVLAAVLGPGCSKEKRALAEIREAFEGGEYREAVAYCRHAIRKGIDVPELYYYYGASLVALNRDFEGFRQFERAAEGDPSLSPAIAEYLYESGSQSFRKRLRSQAAKRMLHAAEIDPALDLGPFVYLVADEYFAENDYAHAAQTYARAISQRPDTSAAEEAYLNLAKSYVEIGTPTRARESLEEMLGRYPDGSLATQARWRLVNLLYEEGEKQFVMGNYEDAVEVLNELLTRTRNPGMSQKSRYLLGETYERMGEYEQAYRQYKQIIDADRGASGRIVDKARQKIAALREAGLY